MTFHKIKNVKALDNLILEIIFENEEIKYYDIKKLISEHKEFEILRDRNLFNLVKIDVGGYGISWNDDLDISCNTLYYELYPNSTFHNTTHQNHL